MLHNARPASINGHNPAASAAFNLGSHIRVRMDRRWFLKKLREVITHDETATFSEIHEKNKIGPINYQISLIVIQGKN